MRSIMALFALLVFLSVAVEGGFYFHSIRESLRNEIVGSADDDVQDFEKRISISLSESQKISAALAGLEELSIALARQTPGNMQQADAILDIFSLHSTQMFVTYWIITVTQSCHPIVILRKASWVNIMHFVLFSRRPF